MFFLTRKNKLCKKIPVQTIFKASGSNTRPRRYHIDFSEHIYAIITEKEYNSALYRICILSFFVFLQQSGNKKNKTNTDQKNRHLFIRLRKEEYVKHSPQTIYNRN